MDWNNSPIKVKLELSLTAGSFSDSYNIYFLPLQCHHKQQGYFSGCKTLLTNGDVLQWSACASIFLRIVLFKKILGLVTIHKKITGLPLYNMSKCWNSYQESSLTPPMFCHDKWLETVHCLSDLGHWCCISPLSIVTWESRVLVKGSAQLPRWVHPKNTSENILGAT